MASMNKGKSPFYPGQPVPIELFTGRQPEIARITRAIGQVELGKPQALFLEGEYGIGKSSLAGFMKVYAEREHHLLGLHVFLGVQDLDELAVKTVEAVIKSQAFQPTTGEKVRNFLSKYLGQQDLLGLFSVNLEALRADGPKLSNGYLPFLRQLLERVREDGVKGIMLIFDEINGITRRPEFAYFLKTLVDENALSPKPLPLMLMLCGVEERRRDLIEQHRPVKRLFDIVSIDPLNGKEMEEFFKKAYTSVSIGIDDKALAVLSHYSAGFPRIMHVVGDAVFWTDQDGHIDPDDASTGILTAAEDIGRKFVDQQVYEALKSKDYHSILAKLAKTKFDLAFKIAQVESELSEAEKKKLNNFLQRMKKLKVLQSGEERGEYVFTSRMVRLYFMMKAFEKKRHGT